VEAGSATGAGLGDGRSPDLAGEPGSADCLAVVVGEDEPVGVLDREALKVPAEGVDDHVGQWNRAVGRGCLRWAEEGLATGQQDELLVDAKGAALEVDVFVVEAEALSVASPLRAARGEVDPGWRLREVDRDRVYAQS
jgi:hypothetical protein